MAVFNIHFAIFIIIVQFVIVLVFERFRISCYVVCKQMTFMSFKVHQYLLIKFFHNTKYTLTSERHGKKKKKTEMKTKQRKPTSEYFIWWEYNNSRGNWTGGHKPQVFRNLNFNSILRRSKNDNDMFPIDVKMFTRPCLDSTMKRRSAQCIADICSMMFLHLENGFNGNLNTTLMSRVM